MARIMGHDGWAQHDVFMRALTKFGSSVLVESFALRLVSALAARNAGYRVTPEILTAATMGMSPQERDEAFNQALAVGLITPDETEHGVWRLINEPDKFVSIRTQDEIDHDRRRKADNSSRDAMIARALWGDACAYCGRHVNWYDRRGNRGGLIAEDARANGQMDSRSRHAKGKAPALVVSCAGCNRERSDNPDADQIKRLRPLPVQPFFSRNSPTPDLLRERLGPDHELVRGIRRGQQEIKGDSAVADAQAAQVRAAYAARHLSEVNAAGRAETTRERQAAAPRVERREERTSAPAPAPRQPGKERRAKRKNKRRATPAQAPQQPRRNKRHEPAAHGDNRHATPTSAPTAPEATSTPWGATTSAPPPWVATPTPNTSADADAIAQWEAEHPTNR